MRILISLVFLYLFFSNQSLAQEAADDNSVRSLLPSAEQQDAFNAFSNDNPHNATAFDRFGTRFFGLTKEPTQFPPDSVFAGSELERVERPVSAIGQINVQFSQTATIDEIQSILEQFQLEVIDVDSRIGMWTLSRVFTEGFAQDLPSTRALNVLEDGLNSILGELRNENIVAAAARNPYLTPNVLRDATVPRKRPPSLGANSEIVDWGIHDAGITPLWSQNLGEIKVGVVDTGFADHEDIDFIDGLPHQFPTTNHGNHVSGIACAKHNGLGATGVVPNCKVVRASPRFILNQFEPIESEGTTGWNALFSEVTATVLDFIDVNPEVKIINLSLGYNWMPNFSENPEDLQNAELRDEIRALGRFHATVLAYAKRRDVILVSAVGNDSSTLSEKLDARWASPFNFGAKMVEDLDGWTNGVIVEAHDDVREPAGFSNKGGHISAPGVDIYSALAISPSSYGELSGSSMASPYVAGVLAILQTKFNNLTSQNIIQCLLSSTKSTSLGTPILDAASSIEVCKSM